MASRCFAHAAIALSCIAVVNLTGCAFQSGIASDATGINKAAAKSEEQVLLLNILRAANDEPMEFTELQKTLGIVSRQFQLGLDLPLGTSGKGSTTPGITLSESPNFDVMPLSTQDFMNGIMTPIEPKLYKYYWDEGWPTPILLYLFVDKIKVNGVVLVINHPGDPSFKKFRNFISCTERKHNRPTVRATDKKTRIPILRKSMTLAALVSAFKEKVSIFENKHDKTYYVEMHNNPVKLDVKQTCVDKLIDPNLRKRHSPKKMHPLSVVPESQGTGSELILRSPEAILYFLGELVREELGNTSFTPPTVITPWCEKDTVCKHKGGGGNAKAKPGTAKAKPGTAKARPGTADLFYLKHGLFGSSRISVRFAGTRYYVPRGHGVEVGGTMHCLSLLTQLIALHKSNAAIPTTQTVIGVGK